MNDDTDDDDVDTDESTADDADETLDDYIDQRAWLSNRNPKDPVVRLELTRLHQLETEGEARMTQTVRITMPGTPVLYGAPTMTAADAAARSADPAMFAHLSATLGGPTVALAVERVAAQRGLDLHRPQHLYLAQREVFAASTIAGARSIDECVTALANHYQLDPVEPSTRRAMSIVMDQLRPDLTIDGRALAARTEAADNIATACAALSEQAGLTPAEAAKRNRAAVRAELDRVNYTYADRPPPARASDVDRERWRAAHENVAQASVAALNPEAMRLADTYGVDGAQRMAAALQAAPWLSLNNPLHVEQLEAAAFAQSTMEHAATFSEARAVLKRTEGWRGADLPDTAIDRAVAVRRPDLAAGHALGPVTAQLAQDTLAEVRSAVAAAQEQARALRRDAFEERLVAALQRASYSGAIPPTRDTSVADTATYKVIKSQVMAANPHLVDSSTGDPAPMRIRPWESAPAGSTYRPAPAAGGW